MSPNRMFMFLINPPSGNVRIQKLHVIGKHIFECFDKTKGEDRKVNIQGLSLVIWKLQSTYYFLHKTPNKHVCLSV